MSHSVAHGIWESSTQDASQPCVLCSDKPGSTCDPVQDMQLEYGCSNIYQQLLYHMIIFVSSYVSIFKILTHILFWNKRAGHPILLMLISPCCHPAQSCSLRTHWLIAGVWVCLDLSNSRVSCPITLLSFITAKSSPRQEIEPARSLAGMLITQQKESQRCFITPSCTIFLIGWYLFGTIEAHNKMQSDFQLKISLLCKNN